MTNETGSDWDAAISLPNLRACPDPDATGQWPYERLGTLRDAGFFRWGLPVEFGGSECTGWDRLVFFHDLATVCLSTAFILTQREAACQRIASLGSRELQQLLLPDLCAGRSFATVGISHLSTSRQHWTRPTVTAQLTPSGVELSGEVPWVTGTACAETLVTGGTTDSGDQILVAVPVSRTGVTVGPPQRMLALNGSWTGSVILDKVSVFANECLAGPVPSVMALGGTHGTGSLTTTAVALGAAAGTLAALHNECFDRDEVHNAWQGLDAEHRDSFAQMRRAAAEVPSKSVVDRIRIQANSLAIRAAVALMSSAKGRGFVVGHPAERAIREAMFFQVWSCPANVTCETLSALTSGPAGLNPIREAK